MSAIRRNLPFLLLVALLGVLIVSPANTLGQGSIDDSFQPIVVTGSTLQAFLDMPVDELFVYAYQGDDWNQIPYQIDEKTMNEENDRIYTVEGDGRLGLDEELVFMWKDMGEQAPASAWVEEASQAGRIELAAAADDGRKRWVYLYHGSGLTKEFDGDYVRFSGAAQRIIAERYEAGFLDNGMGLDELRLNGTGVDILDRTKLRLEILISLGPFETRRSCNEDNLTEADGCQLEPRPIVPLKDGPVRLIRGEEGGFSYGGLFQEHTEADLSDVPIPGDVSIESFRFSWDFNEQVTNVATSTPTTYLDQNLSEPVIVDGRPDDVPTQPAPTWRQISHETGTLLFVSDLSSIGGTQRNYYKDDSSVNTDDTGDKRSYGDSGFTVENPNTTFALNTGVLILPPTFESVGGSYAELLATPPTVTATLQLPPGELDRQVYLPLVRR